MDNNAFKDLVRSKVKSTKQIAREAVEQAFAKKNKTRKRRRRDDDDLDSSDSDTEKGKKSKKGKKKSNRKEDEDDDEKDATATKEHYRDRAQERREGKNVDYQESQVLLETVKKQASASEGLDETELSKFLGGDEAHTHLVKGLDVALAQTVRQKMQEQQEGKVDRGDEEEDEEDTGKKNQPKVIDTKDGAREYVLSSSSQPAGRLSALGRSVLPYLQHKLQPQDPKTVTGAGAAIHRSQLVFCVDWNPQNLALSWEVPSEKSRAAATVQATHHGTGLTKASPLTRELIHQMQKRFQKSNHGITIIAAGTAKEQQGSGPKTVVENDDSSDDDIFPATGD